MATLAATPTSTRVQAGQSASIALTGSGGQLVVNVTKLEVFKDSGNGYGATPVLTLNGNAASLALEQSIALPYGSYRLKLRATDSGGRTGESAPVVVNVTDTRLMGGVTGIRAIGEKMGVAVWVLRDPVGAPLPYEIYVHAPSALGGTKIASGTIGGTAPATSRMMKQAQQVEQEFWLDLGAAAVQYPGAAVYVEVGPPAGARVVLPGEDNITVLPGALRIGLTSPTVTNNDRFHNPNPAFLRTVISGYTGELDEVQFNVDGNWLAATAEPGVVGAYSVLVPGLAVRPEPYRAYGRVRQGKTTLITEERLFYVEEALAVNVISPASGAAPAREQNTLLSATVSRPAAGQSVMFYANGNLLGSAVSQNSIWKYDWTPTQTGSVSVVAKLFNTEGAKLAESTPVSVMVVDGLENADSTPVPIVVTVPQLENGEGGTLPGGVSVRNDGTAAYSIPIKVPPGILSMVPNISLDYSSGNPTGLAGLGWSIGGISRIDRCGKVIATDGRGDGVRFMPLVYNGTDAAQQPTDRLCLDGQRLVLVNGNANSDTEYWTKDAQYRTEVESFTRVTALESNGKGGYKVETKDGRVAYYGDTSDSRIEAIGRNDGLMHRWYVARVSDRSGNYISYAYNEDTITGESNPASISWGGNHGTSDLKPHSARIDFVYEARQDPRTSYIAGSPVSQNMRLRSISTSATDVGGSWMAALEYTLTYEVSKTSGRSLLSSVGACDGVRCLPATTFSWGQPSASANHAFEPLGPVRDGPDLRALSAERIASGMPYPDSMHPIVVADFNGDGKSDIIERYRVGANQYQQRLYVSNNDGTGWNTSIPLSSVAGNVVIKEVGDFDGDGLPDLMTSIGSVWQLCLAVRRENGAYKCDLPVTFPAGSLGDDSVHTLRIVRDYNADGKDDVFLRSDSSSLHRGFQCLSNGSGFDCIEVTGTRDDKSFGTEGDPMTSSGSLYTDVDGDGRTDTVQLRKCVWEVADPETRPRWHCGNGLFGENAGGISVFSEPERGALLVDGGWNEFPNQHTGILPQMVGGNLTADLNADGYSDMVFGSINLTDKGLLGVFSGRVCYSKGDGKADCQSLPGADVVTSDGRDHLVLTLGDFDGDGIYDVLRPQNDTWNESNVTAYQLCRIGTDTAVGADSRYHRCIPWAGPTFYGISQKAMYDGGGFDPGVDAVRSQFLGDFNGDGKQDIVTYLNGGRWQIHSAARQAKDNEALDKLAQVVNGVGNAERVDYALANDASVYQSTVARPNGDNFVGKLIHPSGPLVKATHKDNGVSGTHDTSFKYFRLAADQQGRGNLGFARIERTDVQRGVVSTVWPCLVYPMIGSDCYRSEVTSDNIILSETNDDYLVKVYNAGKTRLPYLSKSTVKRRDPLNHDLGTVVSMTAEPDAWGNIGYSSALASNDANTAGWKIEKSSTYNNDESSWRLGELATLREVRSNSYKVIERNISYTYTTRGLLESESRVTDDSTQALKTTYERTPIHGLISKTTLSWKDAW